MSVRNRLGFTYHDAVTSDHEELAASLYLRAGVSPGLSFSRKMGHGRDKTSKKYSARQQVLALFTPDAWPETLNILTFPGLKWEFERKLIGLRMQASFAKLPGGETNVHALESEQAIFRASLRWMPGIRGESVRIVNAHTVSTGIVREYQCVGFEEYVASPNFHGYYNAAWLDFTGFLTERRLASLVRFWNVNQTMKTMVVTLMNARHSREMNRRIRAGGTGLLLQTLMPESLCVSEMTYADPTPMVQVVLERRPS